MNNIVCYILLTSTIAAESVLWRPDLPCDQLKILKSSDQVIGRKNIGYIYILFLYLETRVMLYGPQSPGLILCVENNGIFCSLVSYLITMTCTLLKICMHVLKIARFFFGRKVIYFNILRTVVVKGM